MNNIIICDINSSKQAHYKFKNLKFLKLNDTTYYGTNYIIPTAFK